MGPDRVAESSRLIVLAPHYDDAVFSVGGLINRHVRGGGRVEVVTVFGGPPVSAEDAGSPLALELHERWLGAMDPSANRSSFDIALEVVLRRRREDAEALAELGAAQKVLAFPDCIWRRAPSGDWRCGSERELFDDSGPNEPAIEAAIGDELRVLVAEEHGETLILAPLGLGGHVDHVVTRGAVRSVASVASVAYYEEVPYALWPATWSGLLVDGFRPQRMSLGPQDIEAKIRASAAYKSQWPTFWPTVLEMEQELTRAARSGEGGTRLAEFIWVPH